MEKIIIIIPTYNEKENIVSIIERLQTVFQSIKQYDMGILIFDSNSPDQTGQMVKQLQQRYSNLYLQTEPRKSGLGSAYIQAMQYAIDVLRADIVFEFDADGSHNPNDLPAMIEYFSKGTDVVLGSRYLSGGSIPKEWAFHRKFLSVIGNKLSRFVLNQKIKDYTTGFRGTRTVLLKKIDLNTLKSRGYAYKIHLLWLLQSTQAKIIEYPIQFTDRKKGYSKLPKNNVFESLALIFYLRWLQLKRYFKVCVVGAVGVVVQLLSFNVLRQLIHPVYANMWSIEFAIISNFILNNYFSFHDKRLFLSTQLKSWIKKLALFNFFSLGSLLLQTLIMFTGLHWFGHGVWLENSYLLIGVAIGSIYNYQMYQHFVWKI